MFTSKLVLPERDFLIWFAGFWEGEGSVIFNNTSNKNRGIIQFTVCQNEFDVIDLVVKKFGIGHVYERKVGELKTGFERRSSTWIYQTSGASTCLPILKAISPFLRVKKRIEKVKLAIAFCEKFIITSPFYWSNEQDKFLSEKFSDLSDEQLAKELNKTLASIKRRRQNLNLIREFKSKKWWGSEEVKILKENFLQGNKRLCELLPNKSFTSITTMKWRLGLTTKYVRSLKPLKKRWGDYQKRESNLIQSKLNFT